MSTYSENLDTLEEELNRIQSVFAGLSDEQWRLETELVPLDTEARHWTVFELAGHFDISIGLSRMLMADPQWGQVGRDRG